MREFNVTEMLLTVQESHKTPCLRRVANYLMGEMVCETYRCTFLQRAEAFRMLLRHGKKTFYASEIFKGDASTGGIMNGLYNKGLVDKTGNTKFEFVEVGENLFRRYEVCEWKLNYPVEALESAYYRVAEYIKSNL